MAISAFITVRTKSIRLPQKCLLPFGDGNVLQHMIRRTIHYGLEPFVCTTIDKSDDIIEDISKKEGVNFFRGSVDHKLKRWGDCCNKFGVDSFHTLDADDPFFDGELVRKSFALLSQGYDVVYPTESSSAGAASVGFSLTRDIVARACKLIGEDVDTEMAWHFLEKVPGLRCIKLKGDSTPVKVRLTLDYEEDYWLLKSVQNIIGGLAPRSEVDDLFRRNPDLYKINWFRNHEWKKNQEQIIT